MPGKAAKIVCSENQYHILQQISRASTAPQRLVQRAKIILLGFRGSSNYDIGMKVGLASRQVGKWRRRWQQSFDALVAIECEQSGADLRRAVEDVLNDAPRCGAPLTFTLQQIALIQAIACESPERSGRPIDRWTHRELADEVVKRGIVKSISVSQVGKYLKRARLQPHRRKHWLNTKEKDPAVYQKQVEAVCEAYLEAPKRESEENTHTVCVDEMPGIQALQRPEETPMRPGCPVRIEFEYQRNGTLCLTGNWDVAKGQMISPTIQVTRTEAEFAQHVCNTVATDPSAGWLFVADNLNTHCSATLVHYVARLEGINPSTLGIKGKSGILQSMATRREFLSEESHRVRFLYLPKHTSWLNQIEIVFGIIHRRAVQRGSFSSLKALKDRLLRFIDYFNRTFAKPINWTYTGHPTATKTGERPLTWRERWANRRKAKDRESLAVVA